jgi:RHS repeat-associated protein
VVSLTGATPDTDSYTFDSNTGRMTNYAFTVGATPETLNGALAWTAQGSTALASLTTIDGFNPGGSLTSSDTYDSWNRLTSFDNGSNNWGQNFSYDLTDNLTKSVITGRRGTSWNPGYSSTTNQCIGCSYDSDGNQTADGTGTNYWGYDAYSKQAWYNTSSLAPTCGTNGKCFTYDAFGRAVEMSNGGSWVELWLTQAGSAYMSGTTLNYATWAAPEGGSAVIVGNSTSLYYLHKDWVGNARVASDTVARTVTADQAYTPYGEIFANYGSTSSYFDNFAGMTASFNNGIQYETPNREFAIFGRWLSPDPAGTGWNQYAYPTNPNSFSDPSGLFFDADPSMDNDAHGSQSEDRDFANSAFYMINGVQVSADVFNSAGGSDLRWAFMQTQTGPANIGEIGSYSSAVWGFSIPGDSSSAQPSIATIDDNGNVSYSADEGLYTTQNEQHQTWQFIPVGLSVAIAFSQNLGGFGSSGPSRANWGPCAADCTGVANSMKQVVTVPLTQAGTYLGCVGRGAALGALGGTAKAAATWFFGPPGWAANIVGGAAAGGTVAAVVCGGY